MRHVLVLQFGNTKYTYNTFTFHKLVQTRIRVNGDDVLLEDHEEEYKVLYT